MRCCHAPDTPAPFRRATHARRLTTLTSWATPLVTLALIPKCPLCLAAWVLLTTGVNLSPASAAFARSGLIVISIAAIALLALRAVRLWCNRPAAPAGRP